MDGIKCFGSNWTKVSKVVATRNRVDTSNHAKAIIRMLKREPDRIMKGADIFKAIKFGER